MIVASDQFVETDAEHAGEKFETSHSSTIATWAKIRGGWFGPIGAAAAIAVTQRWWETLEVAVRRAVTHNHRKDTRWPVKRAKGHNFFSNPTRLGCLG
jgi:hypothetical protein